jgi:hypothetical protein
LRLKIVAIIEYKDVTGGLNNEEIEAEIERLTKEVKIDQVLTSYRMLI